MKYRVGRINLTFKLVLIILVLNFLSFGASYVYNVRSEEELIKKMKENIGDLSSAIKISVEELTSTVRTDQGRLADYVTRLKNKGVKEISIVSNEQTVIASSNPKRLGVQIVREINPRHKDLFITAKVGNEPSLSPTHQSYNLLVPIVVDGSQLGFVHLDLRMEKYGQFLKDNHRSRMITRLAIFAGGIALSIFLSIRYTRPIEEFVQGARRVASGDLSEIQTSGRKDEIGDLTESFNEMVQKLRRQKELEERLRHAGRFSMLGRMASGVAHEIRNPLNLINLSIDHLRAQIPSWDNSKRHEFEEITSNMKAEIDRLNQVIEKFLNYGKHLRNENQIGNPTTSHDENAS